MFALGEMTDMIIGGSNGELDCDEYGANQGLLLPLDDYIEQWMPLYAERLTMNNVTDSMYAPDGKMYYIGYSVQRHQHLAIISSTPPGWTASAKKCPPRWTS